MVFLADFSQIIENLTESVEIARKEVHEVSGTLLLVQSSLEETQEVLQSKERQVAQQDEELVNRAQRIEEFRLKVRVHGEETPVVSIKFHVRGGPCV